MKRLNFNNDWRLSRDPGLLGALAGESNKAIPITLPHDAMIHRKRGPEEIGSTSTGYYPADKYVYTKKFDIPAEYAGKRIVFLFEGVYMNATVFINDAFAGNRPYGYSQFEVDASPFLIYGQSNTIKVVAVTYKDSRWYTGCGIYRDVYMMIGDVVHIVSNGFRIQTPDVEQNQAMVIVDTTIHCLCQETKETNLHIQICNADGQIVAQDISPLTAFGAETQTARRHLYVPQPLLWSAESPYLYTCTACVMLGELCLDKEFSSFGIRRLQLDPQHGLRVNGKLVKLRGACLHHDNGVIGAASFDDSEERRVALLKAYGANAIRSVHNPASPALLRACDKLGMYVMDESFDMWYKSKSDYDYSLYFPQWWEKDLETMVARDFNHPSVIMYSVGNEIPETGSSAGARLNRRMVEKLHNLDFSRYVINCVNGVLAAGDRLNEILADLPKTDNKIIKPKTCEINSMMSNMVQNMGMISSHRIVGEMTEETFAEVDIAGYNYMEGRYISDRNLYPNRIICGTESAVPLMGEHWDTITNNTHIIGDFTWSGSEYIGETGICKYDYSLNETHGIYAPYPWYVANSGMFDLIGVPRAAAYFMQIAWNQTQTPYIAVQRPQYYGQAYSSSFWALSDVLSSWTYPGYEGKPAVIEIYSAGDQVELFLNGDSLGKKPAGLGNRMTSVFETTYKPGKLLAISYKDGEEIGRSELCTVGEAVRLHVECDRTEIMADSSSLAFITIKLVDANGQVNRFAQAKVHALIEGVANIHGFGSGNPMSEESFDDDVRMTYDGYSMLVLRATGEKGGIHVKLTAEGFSPVKISLNAK